MISLANSYLAGSVLLALVLFCQHGVLDTLREQGLWPWLCLCQILVSRGIARCLGIAFCPYEASLQQKGKTSLLIKTQIGGVREMAQGKGTCCQA